MKLVLGSSSIFRQAILKDHGFVFDTASPDIDEEALGMHHRTNNNAEKLTLELANLKADALQNNFDSAILVCSDQVIVYQGEIREKPKTTEECRNYLRSYTNSPAESVTAVVVVNTKTGKRAQGIDHAKQYFAPIPEIVIEQAISEGTVMKSAGGFLIENQLFKPYLLERTGDPTSIMGLPILLMTELIKNVQQ
jgi:septum formation protein